MARFARLDSQIRANGLRVPELNPFFCESSFGALKIVNRRFEAIRANRSNIMKIRFSANRFARIDSRESPRSALRTAAPSKILAARHSDVLQGQQGILPHQSSVHHAARPLRTEFQGEIIYAPPLPPCLGSRHFQGGEGGGCIF